MGNSFLKQIVKNAYWSAYGSTFRNPPLPPAVRSILFICLGNICRSPFAERIAKKHSKESDGIAIHSAGIRVETPMPSPIEAVESAERFGVSLRDHSSRQLRYGMMESHDIVVAVEVWQARYLGKLFPERRDRIFLLPYFIENNNVLHDAYDRCNIRDPYGRHADAYDACFKRIGTCVSGMFSSFVAIPDPRAR
jgi:protein-tyrosine phosphatase